MPHILPISANETISEVIGDYRLVSYNVFSQFSSSGQYKVGVLSPRPELQKNTHTQDFHKQDTFCHTPCIKCLMHTCTDTTHTSSDTHLFTASSFAFLKSHKQWTIFFLSHSAPFQKRRKGRTKYFLVPGVESTQSISFYGPFKNLSVI